MAVFLSEQSESLKMLALFHEVRKDIDANHFQFMEKISFMELTSSDVFVVIKDGGRCVMATPAEYTDFFLEKNFAEDNFYRMVKKRQSAFITKALAVTKGKGECGEKQFFIFIFTPIYKSDGAFVGIIGIGFEVKKLFYKYFKPLEATCDGSMICVTDKLGNIEVFKNNSIIKKNSSQIKPQVLPSIPQKLVAEGYHGAYEWKMDDGRKKDFIIYHPIQVDDKLWIAQFRIPYETIDKSLLPFYWKMFVSLAVIILMAVIGIIVTVMTGKQIRKLKQQINELEIQIDNEKRRDDVEKITSSDYFQDLLQQAEKLKKE
jgi:hypothetical protein